MYSILDDRERLVLSTIVQSYIQDSEPVGSRNVSKNGPLKMSPATIRNIMGDLEEKGYLAQPHTSAGRVPTDLAYRYYIDNIVVLDDTDSGFAEKVHSALSFSAVNLSSMMAEFSKRIGFLTQSVGFVVASRSEVDAIKQIEFTRLNQNKVLGIVITRAGFVKNVIINVSSAVSDAELVYMGNYLTEQLAQRGVASLLDELNADVDRNTDEVRNALSKLVLLEKESTGGLFMEGASNILNFPEFKDADRLKSLLKAIEEKRGLLELLERCITDKGVQIFIGKEIGQEMDDLGIVMSPYEKDGHVVGMLGIIGPKRMEYGKVISVVSYSAQAIEQMINELYGGFGNEP